MRALFILVALAAVLSSCAQSTPASDAGIEVADPGAWWFASANSGDASGLARAFSQNPRLVDATDRYGQTALEIAVRLGHEEAVRFLVDHGAPLDRPQPHLKAQVPTGPKSSYIGWGRTPLGMAIAFNHVAIANFLLDRGADPHIADGYGHNNLYWVCDAGLTRRLLAAGLDPNEPPRRSSIYDALGTPRPLLHAVDAGCGAEEVQALLDAGADPAHAGNMRETALYLALNRNRPLREIRALLDAGAPINARTQFGNTPLMEAAARYDDPVVITWLLERGADVMAKSNDGHMAIDLARGRNAEAKRRLISEAMERAHS